MENNSTFNLPNNSPQRQLVETGTSGRLWYRLYSDGWVEQNLWTNTNGRHRLTMLKEMQDNTYSITCGNDMSDNTVWYSQKAWPASTTQIEVVLINCVQAWFEVKGWSKSIPAENNIKQIIKY